MRSLALLVLVPLVPLVAVPPPAAATETCQGRTATLVGTYAQPLDGTEGSDVIVTNGASRVAALGGDDVVCVTGRPGETFVDAGPGDDVVDAAAAPPTGASAVLGPGSDRYIGSSAPDTVSAGEGSYPDVVDVEADDITTGPIGAEGDVVVTGQPGTPNPDQVAIASGRLEWSGHATPTSLVQGGPGAVLQLRSSRPETVTIDAVAGTAAVDSVHSLAFRGIFRFELMAGLRAPRRLTYVGRPYLDVLDIVTASFPRDARHLVSLGGGNDELRLDSFGPVPPGVTYDAGAGRHDRISVSMTDERRVRVDVGRGELTVQRRSRVATASIPGFEDAEVRAKRAELVGGRDDNTLRSHACWVEMSGGAGRDQLIWLPQGSGEELLCVGRRARLSGGGGRDVLMGSPGADVLDGGRGPDTAHGRGGRDVCRAETVRSCEVRR